MDGRERRGIEAFSRDILANQGYLYTTSNSLSSRLANRRRITAAASAADLRGKRVLDIGCGDGALTADLYDEACPESMHGIDPVREALSVAERKKGGRRITFSKGSVYDLPFDADSFDAAVVLGVLHHLDAPEKALREILRVAPVVVVLEPNGLSPVVKLLERFSRYHVEHGERSFPSWTLDRWVGRLGAAVKVRRWVCLVPVFCPDWFARCMKLLEPLVERLPVVNRLVCATYLFVAARVPASGKPA